MNKFGTMLKKLRTEREISQADMARILGLSRSTVGMYERGKREPDFETLERIADYFSINLDDLTGRGASESDRMKICTLIERCYGDGVFEIVQKIMKLDANDRQVVKAMADSLLSTDKYKRGGGNGKI